MALIATFELETPILQEALNAVPEMVLQTEALHAAADGTCRGVVWASGDDFSTFEAHLERDPTVASYRRLTELDERRLYRVTFSAEGAAAVTYPVVVEHDVTLLESTGTHESLQIRARFPSRDALIAYREACRERDVPFRLLRLYREERLAEDGGARDPHGLTGPQREALLRALEMGYFDVPRRTSLAEIADELGVSTQALSTRLRRGQENLLRNTLTLGSDT